MAQKTVLPTISERANGQQPTANSQGAAFGLYIHIPFCRGKCLYCDFNSYPKLEELHRPYLSALKREIELTKEKSAIPRVTSVYFGGGTPTVYAADDLVELLCVCEKAFTFDPDAEITVEANPETIELSKLSELRRAGFNRISIGFQSLDDGLLEVLGRRHSRKEALEAYRSAREAGFENTNLDLIFGIEGQTLTSWQAALEEAVSLDPEHISTYCLELRRETSALREAPEDLQADMFELAIAFLTANGYRHYEISNFAREGCECRHNLNCWRNGEYLGLGAGAHSHLTNRRFSNLRLPSTYLAAINKGETTVEQDSLLSRREIMEEEVFLGLRLREGVDLAEFEDKFGLALEKAFPQAVFEQAGRGLLCLQEGRLSLSRRGLFLANEVLSSFL